VSTIYTALVAAMADIAKTGIAKTSRADLGGAKVNFRGIEAAMNEMSVVLIRHGISVTPAYSDLSIQERAKGDGKATRFVTVKGRFTFAAADGSSVACECYGEAMDSGDKATTKAQSVAFRTALFQQFVVPTMAMDPEADGEEDDTDDALLAEFRDAALGGAAALREFFKTKKPPEAFWRIHGDSLKAAAAAADQGAK
jgi:ERF superfamily